MNTVSITFMRRAVPHLRAAMPVVLAAFVSAPAAAQGGRPAVVEVNPVREEAISQTVPVVGRVVPRRSGTVAAAVAGPVAEVPVRVGERVAAGAVLVRLDPDLPSARLAQRQAAESLGAARVRTAQAEQELVRLELARLDRLRGSAAFSKAVRDDKAQQFARRASQVREAQAALAQARAERRIAEIELDRTAVRAPYAGVVTARHVTPGGYVRAGDRVATLVDDRNLEMEADVPAERLAALHPGLEIAFELDDGSVHAAAVRAVIPDENPLTRTRQVRFILARALASEALLAANQSIVARIPIADRRTVASVHKDAVVRRRGQSLVYVAEGTPESARAEARPIRLGEAVGSRFVVLEGLAVGELVVIRGNERIQPGQAIRFVTGS